MTAIVDKPRPKETDGRTSTEGVSDRRSLTEGGRPTDGDRPTDRQRPTGEPWSNARLGLWSPTNLGVCPPPPLDGMAWTFSPEGKRGRVRHALGGAVGVSG